MSQLELDLLASRKAFAKRLQREIDHSVDERLRAIVCGDECMAALLDGRIWNDRQRLDAWCKKYNLSQY